MKDVHFRSVMENKLPGGRRHTRGIPDMGGHERMYLPRLSPAGHAAGGLNVKRRAAERIRNAQWQAYQICILVAAIRSGAPASGISCAGECFALAVNEENASFAGW